MQFLRPQRNFASGLFFSIITYCITIEVRTRENPANERFRELKAGSSVTRTFFGWKGLRKSPALNSHQLEGKRAPQIMFGTKMIFLLQTASPTSIFH